MIDDPKARGVRVTREEAQAQIDGLLVAEILRDFGTNFRDEYPDHVLARGVGPEQSMIGLAIKRGHLMVATPAALAASPEVAALIREAETRGMKRAADLCDRANSPLLALIIRAEAAALRGKKTT